MLTVVLHAALAWAMIELGGTCSFEYVEKSHLVSCMPLSLAVIKLGGVYGLELNMWKHSPLSCMLLSLAMIELGGACSFECVKKKPWGSSHGKAVNDVDEQVLTTVQRTALT
jgi:hypothetical protein